MDIKRDDSCVSCGESLPAGTRAVWFASEKVTRCVPCAASYVDTAPGEPDAVAPQPPVLPTLPTPTLQAPTLPAPTLAPPVPTPEPQHESVAGGSAQSEYEKRSARELARKQQKVKEDAERRQALVAERPILGRLASALTPKPTIGPESQATKAWNLGAKGERRVAEVLAAAKGVEALHDRLHPGKGKANIDHIAIGPAGVFVIDAKNYTGAVDIRNVGNIFKPDWQLYVGGRNQMKLVDGVLGQVETVRSVMSAAFPEVPVHGVLCFTFGTWARPMRAWVVKGVTSLWPVKLTEHVSVPGAFGPMVPAITEHLRQQLKPAS